MICASFSMFSQVLARGFPHLSQQVRQGRSFRRQLIFDMAEAEVGGSQGWTTCYESKCKNLEHLCSLGDMLHDMLAKSSKSNSFKLCWTLLYRAEPILYGKFFESCHFALNLIWTWHESTSNRWASFLHQLVRLYSTEICTALLANGSSVQKKNTHARIPALCRSLRLWFLIEPCWATLSWLSIQWATLVEYGLVISIATFLVAGDKLSIRRTFANRMTKAPRLWIYTMCRI
jgi:hypothetical protein